MAYQQVRFLQSENYTPQQNLVAAIIDQAIFDGRPLLKPVKRKKPSRSKLAHHRAARAWLRSYNADLQLYCDLLGIEVQYVIKRAIKVWKYCANSATGGEQLYGTSRTI